MITVKFFILGSLWVWASGDFNWDPHPFWEKPAAEARLDQHEMLVSATNHEGRTWMKGAGRVRADSNSAFQFAQDYDRLSKIPKHFSDVHYDQGTHILSLTVRLLLHSEKLRVKLLPVEKKEFKSLEFEVLDGFAKGTLGEVRFEDLKRQDLASQISMQAVTTEKSQFSWILNLGIEALMKHVANSLRSELEQEAKSKIKSARSGVIDEFPGTSFRTF